MSAMASLLFYVRIDWPGTTDQPGNPVPVAGFFYARFWPQADVQIRQFLLNPMTAFGNS